MNRGFLFPGLLFKLASYNIPLFLANLSSRTNAFASRVLDMLILFLIIKRMFEIQGFLNIFFKLGCSKFGPSPIIFSTDRDVVNLIFRGIIG